MSSYRAVDDLTDAELRCFAAQLAEEVQHLRRALSLLTGLVLEREGHFPDPMPDDIRREVREGLEAFMEHAMQQSQQEEVALHQFNLQRHQRN